MKLSFRFLSTATLALVMLNIQFSFAQKANCGTDQLTAKVCSENPEHKQKILEFRRSVENYIQTHPNGSREIITIPVVFHVISASNSIDASITDAQIQSQIDALNRDFAKENLDAMHIPSVFSPLATNTQIRFQLAQRKPDGTATNGIERRVNTAITSFPDNSETYANTVKRYINGGLDPWNNTKYLNIWAYSITGAAIAGFGPIPPVVPTWQDGVAIDIKYLGSFAPFGNLTTGARMGRTCVHEVGHYLGLCHIWGCYTFCESDDCSDTPIQDHSNFAKPTFPTYNNDLVNCGTSPNGNMFMNHMDYPEDKSVLMFTADQSATMNAVLNNYRLGLKNSDGDIPPTTALSNPIAATGLYADMITETTAQIHWLQSAASTYTVKYKNLTIGQTSFINANATNNYITLTGLSAGNQYEVQIQSNFTGTLNATSSSIFFYTNQYYPCSGGDVPNIRSGAVPIFRPPFSSKTHVAQTIGVSSDEDWYVFNATNFRIILDRMTKDYDVTIYKGNSLTPLDISPLNPFTDREEIRNYNNTVTATYYIQVKGYRSTDYDAGNCYMLGIYWTNSDKTDDDSVSNISQLISIYPNPTSGVINGEFYYDKNTVGKIEIINLSGQILKSEKISVLTGNNSFSVNIEDIASGLYIIKTTLDTEVFHNKIILNK